jgi:hypothetical protein
MRACLSLLALFAALALPGFGAAAGTEPIGRLFSTPAERANLDKLRQLGEKAGAAVEEKPDLNAAPPEPEREQITVDGFVRRSDGKSTTWVNGKPQHGAEISQGITVLQRRAKAPRISVLLRSGRRLDLKAGQTFDIGTSKVIEVYEDLPDAPPSQSPK